MNSVVSLFCRPCRSGSKIHGLWPALHHQDFAVTDASRAGLRNDRAKDRGYVFVFDEDRDLDLWQKRVVVLASQITVQPVFLLGAECTLRYRRR